jgi:hypothetical protein
VCSFRDSLSLAFSAAALVVGQPTAAGGVQAFNDYFPLAAGNSWRYRCEVEGTAQPGKVLQITERRVLGDEVYFKAELKVGRDPKPLVYFLSVGRDGVVRQSSAASTDGAEVVVAADTAAKTQHGPWTSAGTERLRVPALSNVPALRLENFSIDGAEVPASKREEWLARYYAKGVGPVAEADGLGGRCELVSYRVGKVNRTR